MENEAYKVIDKMNELLEKNDAGTAWDIQSEILRVRNSLPPHSAEREKIDELWRKMMIKWH
jgi:hypothetical protein